MTSRFDLDSKAVNDCVNDLVCRADTLDVSFNAIGLKDWQDVPLTEMTLDDFVRPVRIAMKTH